MEIAVGLICTNFTYHECCSILCLPNVFLLHSYSPCVSLTSSNVSIEVIHAYISNPETSLEQYININIKEINQNWKVWLHQKKSRCFIKNNCKKICFFDFSFYSIVAELTEVIMSFWMIKDMFLSLLILLYDLSYYIYLRDQ